MTGPAGADLSSDSTQARRLTLVWIDAREAVIVREGRGRARIVRLTSDVPAHHRATGHVRHDPTVRHGGGGRPQTAGEPRRLEHLDRFVAGVAEQLAGDDDLLILGPGTVRERLVRRLRASDEHHARRRTIACAASARSTDRQLVARLRRENGVEPRRCTVGAYRWSRSPAEPRCRRSRGAAGALPRRVVDKPPRPEA
jgi:hypothetical protein